MEGLGCPGRPCQGRERLRGPRQAPQGRAPGIYVLRGFKAPWGCSLTHPLICSGVLLQALPMGDRKPSPGVWPGDAAPGQVHAVLAGHTEAGAGPHLVGRRARGWEAVLAELT